MGGTTAAGEVRDLARPLRSEADLDPLLERIGEARYVLLGEASHGTSEYYTWRAAITRRLVAERGFAFVAVEGDWPDCHRVNLAVTGADGAPEDPAEALAAFQRWPTWMWANEETRGFLRWLAGHNRRLPPQRRVGFHGLDVYSLWDSLRGLVGFVREHEPEHLETVLGALRCFEPYAEDPQAYAQATWLVPTSCREHVVDVLGDLRRAVRRDGGGDPRLRFDAEQNALVAAGAEAYYREMIRGGPASWNVRDRHMADTLDRLVAHHAELRAQDGGPPDAGGPVRAVVWEHNTHIGDARFTDMAAAGMVNVGQLVRERAGEDDVVLVGFGSHRGTVVAADSWGAPHVTMNVPPARPGSLEDLLHDSLDAPAALFVFPREQPGWLTAERAHRAIGVVYHPHAERWGNYVPTVLGRRYDAFCWIDETRALAPLRAAGSDAAGPGEELEAWPQGE